MKLYKNIYFKVLASMFLLLVIGDVTFNLCSEIVKKKIVGSKSMAPSISLSNVGNVIQRNYKSVNLRGHHTDYGVKNTFSNNELKFAPVTDSDNTWLPGIVFRNIAPINPEVAINIREPGYLKPDQNGSATICILSIDDTVIDEVVAAKSQSFDYRNITLEKLLNIISIWYNVQIVFQYEKAKYTTLGGSLRRDIPLKDLVNIIALVANTPMKLMGNTVIVAK